MGDKAKVGVVIIGRNEGDRLKACLRSISNAPNLVYIDSGSHDGSLEYALTKGITAIGLSSDRPFTAARARNMGIRQLLSQDENVEFIQTVDGDCTISPHWLNLAAEILLSNPTVSTVFGRLRERNPEASIYNLICDEEWNVPAGSAESCGGIAMHRAEAIFNIGGFNEALIAGEEPDLCLRLRRAEWSVLCVDAAMGSHDAAILSFQQWWRRTIRSGFAYAEHIWLHRSRSLPSWKLQATRFAFWGVLLPASILTLLVILIASGDEWAWALLPVLAYLGQFVRIWVRSKNRSLVGAKLAGLAVIGKFAEAIGAISFLLKLLLRRSTAIIEYKGKLH